MTKIAIDAGHYKNTPGKRCLKSIDPNETREWYLNARIADKLVDLLKKYENCETLRVDDVTGNKEIGLDTRCKEANNWKADMYISIHHNAGVGGGSGGGTVVFYYGNDTREKQAQALYDDVVKETKLVGNRSSKVVERGYYVLIHTNMPAFLIENGFMDSTTDTPIILTDEHAEKTAKGICNFIVNQYNLKLKDDNNSGEEEDMKRYNTVDEIPNWGKPTIQKLIDKGYLNGGDEGLGISEDMLRMFVINDRAGLY